MKTKLKYLGKNEDFLKIKAMKVVSSDNKN